MKLCNYEIFYSTFIIVLLHYLYIMLKLRNQEININNYGFLTKPLEKD